MKKVILFVISLFVSTSFFAQQLVIKGNAPSYKGELIRFTTLADPFTDTEILIGEGKVAENGDFRISLNLKQTAQIFTHLGYYKGSMYAEPNTEYEVSFPPRKQKSEAEMLNPFFVPTEFYVVPLNTDSTELNKLIMNFDGAYNGYINQHFQLLYLKQFKPQLDKHILKLDSVYASTNTYFNLYKKFRFGSLRYASYLRSEKILIDEYFLTNGTLCNILSYTQLFRQVFENYFVAIQNTETGIKISEAIEAKRSFVAVNNALAEMPEFKNDTLRELVILSSLYDAYYAKTYSAEAIISVVDDLSRKSAIELHRTAAHNMKSKFIKLLPGHEAPLFTLNDVKNEALKLTDKRGKFVYLCFCNTVSFACIEQLDMIKQMKEEYKEMIDFVCISTDEDFNKMIQLAKKKQYDWDFVSYKTDQTVVDKYNVVAYPTYYLIDPEGNLAMSPAPSPKENFSDSFFAIWNSRRIKEMQGKGNQNGSNTENKDKKER